MSGHSIAVALACFYGGIAAPFAIMLMRVALFPARNKVEQQKAAYPDAIVPGAMLPARMVVDRHDGSKTTEMGTK